MRTFAALTPHEQKIVNQYLFTRQRAEIQAVLLRADLEKLALTFGEEDIDLASCTLSIHSGSGASSGLLEWQAFLIPKRKGG